ncbi:MAG: hypothetical protein ACI9KE_002222 [Polyangiales bacterium]|jgi:hypothetical protein
MESPEPLGFWKNTTRHTTPRSPIAWADPRALPRSRYEGQKSKIVAFLRGGESGEAYLGYSYCRFEDCTASGPSMGSTDRTDGTWVWPEGLVHYVDAHDVALPPEFIEYVLRGTPVRTQGVWVRWSAQHRNQTSDETPAAIEDVRALSSELTTATYLPAFDAEAEWWLVRNGDSIVDRIRPRGFTAMEVYLHARRTIPSEQSVDVRTARRVLRADNWSDRIRDVLRRRRVVSYSGQPTLFEGTAGIGLVGHDEVALRYRMRVANEDAEPFSSAVKSRFARLWP